MTKKDQIKPGKGIYPGIYSLAKGFFIFLIPLALFFLFETKKA